MTDGCKLDIVADDYGVETADARFESLDEELVARWRGEFGFAEHGYRSLSTWFNTQLLRAVYVRHDRETLGTRLDDEFETLRNGEDLQREELLDDLAADGIDGDDVESAMVSWSTVRTHLNDCLGAVKERKPAQTEWEKQSVEYARDQLLDKLSDALRSYQNKGRIVDATDADVSVQIRLACPNCPTRVSLSEALDQGYVCTKHHSNK